MMNRIFLLCIFFFSQIILANDSAGTTAAGGIQFKKTPTVKIVKEELIIQPNKVNVTYQFQNISDKPVALTVFFPLPAYQILSANDSWDDELGAYYKEGPFRNFKVTVDGQQKSYKTITRAMLNGKDITSTLKSAGIPLSTVLVAGEMPMTDEQNKQRIVWQARAKQLGFLDEKGRPKWEKQVVYAWEQTFLPGKITTVSHAYKPATGSFFDIVENNKSHEEAFKLLAPTMQRVFQVNFEEMIDHSRFKTWVMNQRKKHTQGQVYTDFRNVNYILSTGGNWAGPILQFKLVIVYPKKGAVIYNQFYSGNASPKVSNRPGELQISIKDFYPKKELQVVFGANTNEY